MAESYAFSLLGVMDHLWFYQTILFTVSPPVLCPENLKYSPTENSQTSLILEDSTSVTFEMTPSQQDDHEDRHKEIAQKERPKRLDLVAKKSRSHSSSPSIDKRQKRLQWSKKYKSLGELELEEVEGFMDLGFIFDKEQTNKKTMNILPGLQRLELIKTKPNRLLSLNSQRREKDAKGWLVKRPNSPLLKRRVPMVSAAADMKNYLRHWAKTVATVIHQES